MIDAGQPAPPVLLTDQDGDVVDLAELRGRLVVLYFYPRDEGVGCTAQACDIRDRWAAFEERGVAVFGVSADDVDAHASFAAAHGLPHRLLADPDRSVIEAYGSWGLRTRRDGTQAMSVQRNTFLIDREGRIAAAWKEVDPAEHAQLVLDAVDRLDRS